MYQERAVPPELAGVVSRLWFLETAPARRYEKILPLPFVHLIVNLSDPYRLYDRTGGHTLVDGAFVSGIQSEYLVIESPATIRNVGAEFTAAGFQAVTDAPATTVVERVQGAHALLDGVDDLLALLTRHGESPTDALDDVVDFLLRRTAGHSAPDAVVEHALAVLHGHPGTAIADLAASAGVSHRTLIARFRASTGLTPKAYAQLWRLHRFASSVQEGSGDPDWAALAADHGFYDQPHVIRAFRRFSGWTPAEYHRRVVESGADAASFVPLDEVPAAPA